MKVQRKNLLLLACLVWTVAGFNIFRIGILSYKDHLSVINLLLSVVVFGIFQYFIFGKLVKKHTTRIIAYKEEKQFFLKFFDVKSFIIMAIMMGGGIALRAFKIAPEVFIAVFYSGLGASLPLAGILFGKNRWQAEHSAFYTSTNSIQ